MDSKSNMKYAFIDECGNFGTDPNTKGNSSHFIITAIVIDSVDYENIKEQVEKIAKALDLDEKELMIEYLSEIIAFEIIDEETSNLTDEEYKNSVVLAKKHCFRGDVFQLVLSRRFEQKFRGDEFNVYRALRNIDPSPYLFFF